MLIPDLSQFLGAVWDNLLGKRLQHWASAMARGGGGPATQSVASMTSAAAIRRSLQNREQLRNALGRQKVCAACVCPASEVGTNTQSSEPSRLGLDELVV